MDATVSYLDQLIGAGLLVPTGVDGLYGRSGVFEDEIICTADGMKAALLITTMRTPSSTSARAGRIVGRTFCHRPDSGAPTPGIRGAMRCWTTSVESTHPMDRRRRARARPRTAASWNPASRRLTTSPRCDR